MSITNYTEMVSAVQSWLNREGFTALDNQIPDFIAFGQRRIMYDPQQMIPGMETFDGSFSISGQSVALPAGLLRVRSIEIQDALGTTPLEAAPLSRVLTYNQLDKPIHYAIRGDNIIFGPSPDRTYTAIFDYYVALDILSDSNATNWFTDNYPELLLSAALLEALLWLKDDARAQVWEAQYNRHRKALIDSETVKAYPYGQTAGARLA